MNRLFRVLIFDNNTGSYDRLKRMSVWKECGFEITGKTSDLRELSEACANHTTELLVCFNRPMLIDPSAAIAAGDTAKNNIACIVVSPYEDLENMRRCFILGVIDYLIEPVSETRLKEALDRAAEKISSMIITSEYDIALKEYFEQTISEDNKFTGKLRELLSGCENKIVTTEYAADWFGFNKDYFGRMFKQKTGMTFGDFYRSFRIRYAQKLLASGKYKVYEVSEMLGFSSVDYFTLVYKKIAGVTPSQTKRT